MFSILLHAGTLQSKLAVYTDIYFQDVEFWMSITLIPFAEELFFRGFVQVKVAQTTSKWRSVYLTSVLFWAFHFPWELTVWKSALAAGNLPCGPGPLLLGFVCGSIAAQDKHIRWAIALHAMANGMGPMWRQIINYDAIFKVFYS